MRWPVGHLVEKAPVWRLWDGTPCRNPRWVITSGELRAGDVRLRYRAGDGGFVESTLDRVSAAEVAGGLPVREFRWYKGRRHYSGWYWAATTQRLVAYESRLELARIMLADFAPAVTAIAAQPFQLVGPDPAGHGGGRLRRHVPDLLLLGTGGEVTVVDIKAPGKRGDPQVRALMEWTRRVAGLRGWGFEEWYGASPRLLDNVRFLAGYRRRAVIDTRLIPLVLGAVGERSSISGIERALGQGSDGAGEAGVPAELVRPVTLHLLWAGELTGDLERPLQGASTVTPSTTGLRREVTA